MIPPRVVDHRRRLDALRRRAHPGTSRIKRRYLLPGRGLLDAWCRGSKPPVMFRLHTSLLPSKQDAMASQFVTDFRTNHQLPRFRDFDLERLARVGRRNRVEIAFIADDTIFATSPGGHHAGIIGERLVCRLQSLGSQPCKGIRWCHAHEGWRWC